MEIRCGGCSKLFRVSDDKIIGKGIKFSCTKCGETIKITREDFENYTLSQTAVTALDQFQSKAKLAPASGVEARPAEATAAIQPAISESRPPETPPAETKGLAATPASEIPDFLQERETPPPAEPSVFDEQPLQVEAEHKREPEPATAPGEGLSEPQKDEKAEVQQIVKAEAKAKPAVELETKPETKPVPPGAEPEPVKEQMPEPKPAAKPEPGPQPAKEAKPAMPPKPEQKPAASPRPAPVRKPAVIGASAGAAGAAKKEAARPTAPPAAVIGASPAQPARSGKMALFVIVIIIVLAGAGAFYYLKFSQKPASEPAAAMTSVAGLHILSAAGSIEANGDLLISGEIENSTDKEQRAWYIVVDVYDANGSVITKLRLLNGKQLFTRNDYEIMARRGMNVKDIKAQILAQQGVVLPPKGKVPFEIRYLDPPKGVASFNSSPQPFDPIRLYREVADEAK